MTGQFESVRKKPARTPREPCEESREGSSAGQTAGASGAGSSEQATAATLRLSRTFQASRERVFRAWTDPRELERWFCPTDTMQVKVAEFDLRPGGRYRLEIRSPEGEEYRLSGVYREVDAPKRLVYTWRWGGWEEREPDSLVTVEFHARGESTEVRLIHQTLPSPEALERHRTGWGGCLDHLARHMGVESRP